MWGGEGGGAESVPTNLEIPLRVNQQTLKKSNVHHTPLQTCDERGHDNLLREGRGGTSCVAEEDGDDERRAKRRHDMELVL